MKGVLQLEQIISSRELVDKILHNENLHPGDKISYNRLIELSSKYNITPYILAVNIFGVTQAQFQSIRSKSSNAKNFIILKHLIPEMIENAIGFRNIIIQEEQLAEGSLINYHQLQEFAKKYDIPEKILAINVLQISEYSYRKIKSNSDSNAMIFHQQKRINTQTAQKDKQITHQRQEILRNESLKIGDKINYEKLVQLSKKYQIDEKKLAIDILGVTISSFNHIKSDKKKNAIILRGFLNEEELKKISIKITKIEGIQPYTQIDYKMLQTLSEKYLINERILALSVLGLTESQYWNMKYNHNMKAYVLKGEYKETKPEELRKLKLRIFEEEKLSAGTRISYEKLENIQKKYSITLNELLYILGITKYAYNFIKSNRRYSSIVKDMDTYLITQILSEIMEKERYYTKAEIKQICEANNISLQDFFDYIFGKAVYFGRDDYERLLNNKGKIWIGNRSKLSNEFVNNHLDQIREIARKVSNHIYYKYKSEKRKLEKEDLEQEACILILETCGDLEKNFTDDELSRMIYLRTRINMLKHIGTESKVVSISEYYKKAQDRSTKGNGKNIDLVIKDENADTEKDALDNYESEIEETSIIGYLSKLVEKGYDRNACLEKTANAFGIDKETMLEVIKEELLRRGKVKQTDKGDYYIGD